MFSIFDKSIEFLPLNTKSNVIFKSGDISVDVKNIEVPKNIFSTIISFSKVRIELSDGSKISLFYIKSPEAFKKGFDLLNILFSIDEENKND